MAKKSNRPKVETIQFKLPSFFSAGQLFGSIVEKKEEKFVKVVFTLRGRTFEKNFEDPKKSAQKYADKMNVNVKGDRKGRVLRLTFKGVPPKAYVGINLDSPKQVAWAKKEKEKRKLREEQREKA